MNNYNMNRKWTEDLNRHFSKTDILNGQQVHKKMHSITNHQGNMNQNILRYHFMPVRMASIIKKQWIGTSMVAQ